MSNSKALGFYQCSSEAGTDFPSLGRNARSGCGNFMRRNIEIDSKLLLVGKMKILDSFKRINFDRSFCA